jgi:hypothetical protein
VIRQIGKPVMPDGFESLPSHRDGGGERHAKLKGPSISSRIVLNPPQGAREIQRHLGAILNR